MPEPVVLSPDEVSRRIVTGVGLVYDLFLEMNALFRLIHQGLEDADAGLQPHGGKSYALPRGKQNVTVADRYVRTDMGMLVTIGAPAAEDVTDDEQEDDAEEAAGDEDEAEVDKAFLTISPGSQFLGLRAVVYDRSVGNPLQFRPVLIAGILSDLRRYRRAQPESAESTFSVRRAHVKRVVKHLRPGIAKDSQLANRIPRFQLGSRVAAVHEVELAQLKAESDVQGLIDGLIEMVEGARA